MSWDQIPDTEREDLYAFYKMKKYGIVKRIAEEKGMTYDNMTRRLREYGQLKTLDAIPPEDGRVYDDYLQIETDNILFISDIEFPDHYSPVLRAALLMAFQWDIKQVALLGDTNASDQAAINHWTNTYAESNVITFRDVLKNYTKRFVTGLTNWFDAGVFMIEGNHDARVAKATGGEISLGDFMEDIPGVRYSPYGYMWIESSNGLIYACHQTNYGKNPLTVGQKIYETTFPKAHIVTTHIHRFEQGRTQDNAFELHALGTCRDPKRTQYKAMNANTHNEWNHSFLILRNGKFYPFVMQNNPDWEFWMPDYYKWLDSNEPLTEVLTAV